MQDKIVAADTETTGLNPYGSFEELGHYPDRPFAFSFSTSEGKDLYIRFDVDPFTRRVKYEEKPQEFNMLKGFFANETITKIFHNAQFDMLMLDFAGLPCKGPILDTLIMAHVANSNRENFGLKPLSKALLNFPDQDLKDLKDSVKKARREGKKLGWALAEEVEADYWAGEPELCKKYAIGDTQRTIALYELFKYCMNPVQYFFSPYTNYADLVKMEHTLIPIVSKMSRIGVNIDPRKAQELQSYYEGWIDRANKEKAALGFPDLNPGSPKQLNEVFYGKLGMKPEFRKRKGPNGEKSLTKTTDKAALYKWSSKHPLAKCLIELSEAKHQLSSFILPFQANSFWENSDRKVLHPNFKTCGPVTGRLSCASPNLQNITSDTSPGRKSDVEFRARECFVPRVGCSWVLLDYSQVELWVAAYASKDALMMSTLASGASLHDLTCNKVFGHKDDFGTKYASYRKMAKIVNFSLLYGSGPKALAELLGIEEDEARKSYQLFWATYSGLKRYSDQLKAAIKSDGFVKDSFGRPYFIDNKFSYKALNCIVQGFSAGVLKRAMINADTYLNSLNIGANLVLTIHDELVVEVPNKHLDSAIMLGIKKAMQGDFHTLLGMPKAFDIEVSLVTDNWGKKSKVEFTEDGGFTVQ